MTFDLQGKIRPSQITQIYFDIRTKLSFKLVSQTRKNISAVSTTSLATFVYDKKIYPTKKFTRSALELHIFTGIKTF